MLRACVSCPAVINTSRSIYCNTCRQRRRRQMQAAYKADTRARVSGAHIDAALDRLKAERRAKERLS